VTEQTAQQPHASQHKLALAGSIIAGLSVLPAWWHIPLTLALAADLHTTIHAPDGTLILILAFVLALYHIFALNTKTHAIGEIAALLIALAAAYLLYADLHKLINAYDALGGPGTPITPPNLIYAIAGIIGALAAAGASAAALAAGASAPKKST